MCFCSGDPVDKDPRANYNARQWETGMCYAPCNNCIGCIGGLFCHCCCNCYLRYAALNGDMSKYTCCQGYVCPSCTKCFDSCAHCCPWPCLFLESFLCCSCSLSGTRMYVQDERQIITDPCDNRIIRCNNCLQCLACICDILACFCESIRGLACIIRLIANIAYLITMACMTAQVHLELNRHPTAHDYGGATAVIGHQPQFQQHPPAPQGAYGKPAGYH
eukprot:m.165230 g.165230  ORF g.165230 m.165230 type:complete len:219 (-) comp9892_c0_seq33:70-726(-)